MSKSGGEAEPKAAAPPQPSGAPEFKQRHYSDGHPLDEVQYLECKIILKPDRFTSAQAFLDYGELVRNAATQVGIDLDTKRVVLRPRLREVVFYDTADFRLYNNAFILRRRLAYEDGFPVGKPEMVVKFRHPDMQKAAELDLRPKVAGSYRIKFKAETLPLKDRPGGYRTLFSHSVQFPLSQVPEGERVSIAALTGVFPCLAPLKQTEAEQLELVNATHIEEVLQDLGTLDFGRGVSADANVAIWRERGTYTTLCGEFSFQTRFQRRDELHEKAISRCREFFALLQLVGRDWLLLGTTKTGIVYRLKGNPPQSHE
jgi:hypothetical protein